MVGGGPEADRDGVATVRTGARRSLLVLLTAVGLLAAAPGPATAAPVPLATWIVTYDAPPSSYQLGVLSGVTDMVHGFTKLPAAVVVAPPGAQALLRALLGVKGVYANETYHFLS